LWERSALRRQNGKGYGLWKEGRGVLVKRQLVMVVMKVMLIPGFSGVAGRYEVADEVERVKV
jgi:hypothetical protein